MAFFVLLVRSSAGEPLASEAVEVGEPVVQGALARQQIVEVVEAHGRALAACFPGVDPPRAAIDFVIHWDGRPREGTIRIRGIGEAGQGCLHEAVRTLQFPHCGCKHIVVVQDLTVIPARPHGAP